MKAFCWIIIAMLLLGLLYNLWGMLAIGKKNEPTPSGAREKGGAV